MTLTRHCPFCDKTIWLEWYAEENGIEVGCDCSTYREHYCCKKPYCPERKTMGSDYCGEHKDCCQYQRGYESCEIKENLRDGYCDNHREKCRSCGERGHVKDGFCGDHRCWESDCNREVSTSERYCSDHNKCCPYCDYRRISQYKESCDRCVQEYKCNYSPCSAIVPQSERSSGSPYYCSSHKAECHYNSIKPNDDKKCEKRVRNWGEKCEDHQKKCEFEKCRRWIDSYSNHCSIHPPREQARLYKEEWKRLQAQLNNRPNITVQQYNNLQNQLTVANNRANGLQTQLDNVTRERDNLQTQKNNLQNQLNAANDRSNGLQVQLNTVNNQLNIKQQEVDWLKDQLKMLYVDEEQFEAWIQENYPPRFRN